MRLKYFFGSSLLLAVLLASSQPVFAQEKIEINVQAQTNPFPHFWEQMFCSGRANLSWQAQYETRR